MPHSSRPAGQSSVITYDPSQSGMVADDVQEAIDELFTIVDTIPSVDESNLVHKTSAETIAGEKTFTNPMIVQSSVPIAVNALRLQDSVADVVLFHMGRTGGITANVQYYIPASAFAIINPGGDVTIRSSTFTWQIGVSAETGFQFSASGDMNLWKDTTAGGRAVAQVSRSWTDATDATRKGRLAFSVADYNGMKEGLRIESDGTNVISTFSSPIISMPTAFAIGAGGHGTLGEYAVAIGIDTVAGGSGAVALGKLASAPGTNGVAIGGSTSAFSDAAISIGNVSVASGAYAIAIGEAASATHWNSIALGRFATSTAHFGLTVGSLNNPINRADFVADASGFTLAGVVPSSTATLRTAGNMAFNWADATDATRKGRLAFSVADYNGMHEVLRISPDVILAGYDAGYIAIPRNTREYRIGTNEGSGSFIFSRSDTSKSLVVTTFNDHVNLFADYDTPLTLSGQGTIILCPSGAGGANQIQLGRRFEDSHPACGASVECWTATGQATPALTVKSPGGSSDVWKVNANGTMINPSIEADGSNPRIGFLGASAVARPVVTGNTFGATALASLIAALASLGLIDNQTTAS